MFVKHLGIFKKCYLLLWVLLSATLAQSHLWTLGRTNMPRGQLLKSTQVVFSEVTFTKTHSKILKKPPKIPCEFWHPGLIAAHGKRWICCWEEAEDRISATQQALVSRAHRGHRGPVYKGCQALWVFMCLCHGDLSPGSLPTSTDWTLWGRTERSLCPKLYLFPWGETSLGPSIQKWGTEMPAVF